MPRPHFTPGKDPVPIVQEAGWAPGPVWTAKNLASPGFDPRTVQPVVSGYTDWATRPTYDNDTTNKYAQLAIYATETVLNSDQKSLLLSTSIQIIWSAKPIHITLQIIYVDQQYLPEYGQIWRLY
jgi:hypothetical protein